MTFLDFPR